MKEVIYMNQLIHTPAGVRDVFGDEYERKNLLMGKINRLFGMYGYRYIQTPTIEYYPVFDEDKGTMHGSKLFRMIDADGHTLVLRPDFTPSIARAVTMYHKDEKLPIRFCYRGNVFLNNTTYRGRLNESTEMGVELINYDSPEADAELIALSVEIMKAAGLRDFQISIGNVAYYNALTKEAGLDEDTVVQIRHLLSTRNQFGALELIEKQDMDSEVKKTLLELTQLFGDVSVLEKAEKATSNSDAKKAIERLKAVYDILKEYGCSENITFDMGMLSDYSYYTGIIMQAVTYGSGDAVIKGGRYNRFIEKFGKQAAAVGFTTLVDSILMALQRQGLAEEIKKDRIMILYSEETSKKAIDYAMRYRAEGQKVTCMPLTDDLTKEAYVESAKADHYAKLIILNNDDVNEEIIF